jgi:molybdate transport system substrate-binding protein
MTAVRRPAGAALAAVLTATLVACGSARSQEGKGGASLTVLAAASLTDVFRQLGEEYARAHRGNPVRFSFAGSQELAAQVRQGVPADVLVTADTTTMAGLRAETGSPTVVAGNRLTIVTAPGNPRDIAGVTDLARTDLKTVLAAPEVPAGRYSREVLHRQEVVVKPVSQEPNVRAVLTKVELGEADAGMVYVTDATAAGEGVGTVDIPAARNSVAAYPAAVLKTSGHSAAAAGFVEWLRSERARRILRSAGFQAP